VAVDFSCGDANAVSGYATPRGASRSNRCRGVLARSEHNRLRQLGQDAEAVARDWRA
jgi:hypothetical protein